MGATPPGGMLTLADRCNLAERIVGVATPMCTGAAKGSSAVPACVARTSSVRVRDAGRDPRLPPWGTSASGCTGEGAERFAECLGPSRSVQPNLLAGTRLEPQRSGGSLGFGGVRWQSANAVSAGARSRLRQHHVPIAVHPPRLVSRNARTRQLRGSVGSAERTTGKA
jgi:hypothetical protein